MENDNLDEVPNFEEYEDSMEERKTEVGISKRSG